MGLAKLIHKEDLRKMGLGELIQSTIWKIVIHDKALELLKGKNPRPREI